MSSVKNNIVLNFINTFTSIIFPIVTFPYAARVLLPEGIGIVNFQQSIINYILLFTSIGIPLYAVREIAGCRDNYIERNKTTIEIFILSFILSIIGYIIVYILGHSVTKIAKNVEIFYILSISILFTSVGVQWFYQAIEDFKYITVRAVLIRILSAAALFVFVKDSSDLAAYSFVLVLTSVGNNLVNFIHLRKYIALDSITISSLNIKKHIKPAFHVFILTAISSLYTYLNSVMLGFMCDDITVGYYTAGNRMAYVVLSITTSMSTVMIPHLSNLIKKREYSTFNTLIQKSYDAILFLSIPFTATLILLSKPLTILFCGTEFYEAISVLVITSPIVIFIGISNLIGIQVLYPQGKENIVIYSTLAGAIMNIIMNIALIPLLKEDGAALAMTISELTVVAFQMWYGRRYLMVLYCNKSIFNYIFASVIMTIAILLISHYIENYMINLLISTIIGSLIYIMICYLKRDYIIKSVIETIIKK